MTTIRALAETGPSAYQVALPVLFCGKRDACRDAEAVPQRPRGYLSPGYVMLQVHAEYAVALGEPA